MPKEHTWCVTLDAATSWRLEVEGDWTGSPVDMVLVMPKDSFFTYIKNFLLCYRASLQIALVIQLFPYLLLVILKISMKCAGNLVFWKKEMPGIAQALFLSLLEQEVLQYSSSASCSVPRHKTQSRQLWGSLRCIVAWGTHRWHSICHAQLSWVLGDSVIENPRHCPLLPNYK